MDERKRLVFEAKLCEQMEIYDEMARMMKALVMLGGPSLDIEERNLLSVAFKNVVGSRRASWRIVSSIVERGNQSARCVAAATAYRNKIAAEIEAICDEYLAILRQILLPRAPDMNERVFFTKCISDYHRYKSEVARTPESRREEGRLSAAAMEASYRLLGELSPVDPIRVGMALSQATFMYEILGEKALALRIARRTFNAAIAHLDDLPEETYRDVTLLMQLLRDNITAWTSEELDEPLEEV